MSQPAKRQALSRRSETKNGHTTSAFSVVACLRGAMNAIVSMLHGAGERENKTLNVVVVNVAKAQTAISPTGDVAVVHARSDVGRPAM